MGSALVVICSWNLVLLLVRWIIRIENIMTLENSWRRYVYGKKIDNVTMMWVEIVKRISNCMLILVLKHHCLVVSFVVIAVVVVVVIVGGNDRLIILAAGAHGGRNDIDLVFKRIRRWFKVRHLQRI